MPDVEINTVVIIKSPHETEGANSAFCFVKSLCEKQENVYVFFYLDGVKQEYSKWQELQNLFSCRLNVCVAAAKLRNIHTDNLVGIGALVEACNKANTKVICFG